MRNLTNLFYQAFTEGSGCLLFQSLYGLILKHEILNRQRYSKLSLDRYTFLYFQPERLGIGYTDKRELF